MTKKEILKSLRKKQCPNSVSIYIPTNLTGDYQANRIRWKNACNEAIETLEKKGVEKTSFLKPAFDLIENTEFWAHQSKGLAGFYSADYSTHHHLINVNESLSMVGDEFFLSPLLKEVINEERIFVLAISQNEVRFFEAVKSGIFPVKIYDVVPSNMEEALNLDIDGNKIQSFTSGNTTKYHGTDSGDDKEIVRLEQYFRRVDAGLLEFIHDEKVPLVLAAVEEYYPIYKRCTSYDYFSNHIITGNPEDLSPADLRKQIEPIFQELHTSRIEKFIQHYNLKSHEEMTMSGISKVNEYALNKNIERMLISQDHWDNMSVKDKKRMDDILFSVYDNGGEIVVANDSIDPDYNTLHAIRRF